MEPTMEMSDAERRPMLCGVNKHFPTVLLHIFPEFLEFFFRDRIADGAERCRDAREFGAHELEPSFGKEDTSIARCLPIFANFSGFLAKWNRASELWMQLMLEPSRPDDCEDLVLVPLTCQRRGVSFGE